jgi:4-hydroxy-3-polyprenylbenzoate decarboxylase
MENMTNAKKRLVIGMSGASGAILGITMLNILKDYPEWESHLVITRGAELTIQDETNYTIEQVKNLADEVYDIYNIGDKLASGTFKTEGMVIIPCSMKTVAGVASGYSDNLLLRAADVALKEGRKLVLAARESPLSLIHLRNMTACTEAGAIILPPMITYYNKPLSIDDMNKHIVAKILDNFGIEVKGFKRWGENI